MHLLGFDCCEIQRKWNDPFLRAMEENHGVEQSLEDSSCWVWNGRLGHLRGPEYSKWVEASKRKNAHNESAEVSKTGPAEALEDLC